MNAHKDPEDERKDDEREADDKDDKEWEQASA